jgi:hypothetical protein
VGLVRGASSRHPDAEQMILAGGSSPRLTIASTGLRPCVRRASLVSSATEPLWSWFIAARETSTIVRSSRPPGPVTRTDQEAPMLRVLGSRLVASRTTQDTASG